MNSIPNDPPVHKADSCMGWLAGVLLTLVILAGLFGVAFSATDTAETMTESRREIELAKIPKTLEERQVDALKDVAEAGYKSNVAIAGTGFAAVTSITWAHTFQVVAIAVSLVAVAVILIVLMSKRKDGNAGSVDEPEGIPVDIPTMTRINRK